MTATTPRGPRPDGWLKPSPTHPPPSAAPGNASGDLDRTVGLRNDELIRRPRGPDYQTVSTRPLCRMESSRVTSGRCSERAVATISRSHRSRSRSRLIPV